MLSVVVASYNSPEMTRRCVESVLTAVESIPKAEVICVDDCSTETGFMEWARSDPRLLTAQHRKNRGPHAAWNTGIQLANPSHHVALVGSDVVVPSKALHMMHLLVSGIPKMGVLSANEVIAAPDPDVLDRCEQSWSWRRDQTCQYGVGIGSCCIISRQALDDVGLFDERFVRTFGDTDWNERAASRGWLMVRLDECSVFHGGSVSRKRLGVEQDIALDEADHQRFLAKWRDNPEVLQRHPVFDPAAVRQAKQEYFNSGEK